MKKIFITKLSLLALVFTPLVIFAAPQESLTSCGAGDLVDIVCRVGVFFKAVLPVLIALAVLWFVWGIITFVIAGDEESRSKGRDKIIYGLIGLAVIIALWGLVNILIKTVGVDQTGTNAPSVPKFPQ